MNTINFDKPKLTQLIKQYEQAVKENKESFFFEGKEVLTGYAKYMIEHLKSRIK